MTRPLGARPAVVRLGVMTDSSPVEYETLLYATRDAVATITLNRPEQLNTIVPPMPDELEAAVGVAVRDPEVKVIVVRGAGRAFCAGYDFGGGFEHWGECDDDRGRAGTPARTSRWRPRPRSRRRRSS